MFILRISEKFIKLQIYIQNKPIIFGTVKSERLWKPTERLFY